MTDSSTQNSSPEVPDTTHSATTDEQVLAELFHLLSNPEQKTTPDAADQSQTTEEDVLTALRDLLLDSEPKIDSTTHNASESSTDTNPATEDELALLRQLLVGPEQTQLVQLQQRLDDPQLHAEDLSRVLPEAIILRSLQQDHQLTQALTPTIEQAIFISVKKDINVLANAIFPVIGPAIRKSIATTLEATIQTLNRALEESFSIQGFKWRIEAMQTGKSLAEVVLLRTLIYRVEQVFLIHKQTGLLLQHLIGDAVIAQDADLVSAMLTAIQDFVQDSFKVEKGNILQTLHFGELTIWIEQGPQAVLAGVICGNAPRELRFVFQDSIEKIHVNLSEYLESFHGDTTPFVASKPYLEACLQSQYTDKKEKEKKHSSPILGILTGGILFALGLWAFLSFQERQRWANYLEALNSQPGIVVVSSQKRHGKYFISGLRDPLAADPIALMQQVDINPKTVISRWEPYLSFDAKFITTRAKQLLQPPKTVSLQVNENGILIATGFAPRQWISQAQKVVPSIPGITQLQTENLIETDFGELQLSTEKIENQILRFLKGSTQLVPGQEKSLQTLIQEIKKLVNTASIYHKNAHIQIVGHTDSDGSEQKNLILGQARAYAMLSSLVSQGIPEINLSAVGVGTRKPSPNQPENLDKALNRRVTFQVFLTDAPKRK